MASFILCDGCKHEVNSPDPFLNLTKDFTTYIAVIIGEIRRTRLGFMKC